MNDVEYTSNMTPINTIITYKYRVTQHLLYVLTFNDIFRCYCHSMTIIQALTYSTVELAGTVRSILHYYLIQRNQHIFYCITLYSPTQNYMYVYITILSSIYL